MTGSDSALLSTPDQIDQELRAARIFALSPVQDAVRALEGVALGRAQARLPSGRSTWRRAMNELAFAAVLRGLNADAGRPRVLWDQNPPRERDGTAIPGSRCTGNNPDTIYRRIPLEASGRYVLRGRKSRRPVADVTFSVLPAVAAQENWEPVVLAASEIETDADGGFALVLDARAGERPNHIRLAPGATRLTIRESMIDWACEDPYALSIERTDIGLPIREASDMDAAERIAGRLKPFAEHWLGYNDRSFYAGPANVLSLPAVSPGGLGSQISALGHFDLRAGEALVIEADRLGAAYSAFQLLDPWMFGLEYRHRTGSLNHGQAVTDPDGRYRFVVSAEDPRVHNWLDTEGLLQGGMLMRWQGFPSGRPLPVDGAIQVRRIPLGEVAKLDLKSISAADRRRQWHERQAAHDRRLAA